MKYTVTNKGILTQEQFENTSPLAQLQIIGEYDTWMEARAAWDNMNVTQKLTPEQEKNKWFAIHGVPTNPEIAVRRQAEYEQGKKNDNDETGQYFK